MIEAKLEDIRRRLLDLSRRNRLLNHRTGGNGTLRIVDEVAGEVFRLLVLERRRLSFLSREEAPSEILDALPDEGDDLEEQVLFPLAAIDGDPRARHADRALQTTLEGERLQSRLLHLAREAASSLEEQGCNILFLTLGTIIWNDGDPDRSSRAPLLFIPVELSRRSVRSRHSMQLFEDDVLTNPSLAELCKRQFRLELPLIEIGEEPPELPDYFARVEEAISPLAGWRLVNEINLGLFSFAKLLMYRDLDPATWPEHRSLASHPLLRVLSGTETPPDAGAGIPDASTIDRDSRPADCFQVLDADSSQQAAILAAKDGVSCIIEGPPGTGKSQTITNIIAECLAQGRTVLFVAEKSAALDVVKRRLEAVGLGEFALELHSRKASKRAVLEEIGRSLGAEPSRGSGACDPTELEALRDRLNAYVRDLHTPAGALGISPFEAISRAVALSGAPEVHAAIAGVLDWTAERLIEGRELVTALAGRLETVGDPARHPWRGARLASAGIEVRQRVRERLVRFSSAIAELSALGDALATELGVEPPATPGDVERLVASADKLARVPEIARATVGDARWNSLSPELSRWLEAGRERQRLRQFWSRYVAPDAELIDWRGVLERRRAQRESLLRFLMPSWYADRRLLRRWYVAGEPPLDEQLALLSCLVESARLRATVEAGVSSFADMFGTAWSGIDCDWEVLRVFADSVVGVRQLILQQAVASAAAERVVGSRDRAALRALADTAEAALERARSSSTEFLEAIEGEAGDWLGAPWRQALLGAVEARLAEAMDGEESLRDWADYQSTHRACLEAGLDSFLAWALSPEGLVARDELSAAFSRHFYRLWIDAISEERSALRGFRGEDREAMVARFRALDVAWIEASRARLAELVRSRRPGLGRAHKESKLGIVQAEIRKQRNHMPLRRLFTLAGDVVQAIKPCFMMSPISVAQYLAPGALEFDVVIFDEASQVEPADAYGAIARGRQVVLVGDEKQLPPTNFFSKIEADEERNSGEEAFASSDLESVLALGVVRFPERNRCSLRWHYRSRHESLIDFSNQKFYDGRLRIFPSAARDRGVAGLSFRFVEGGVYQRAAGQQNPVEARAVAEAVIEHAVEKPLLSLGVGAFSLAQQRAIQDEIERLRRESTDERVEQYFQLHPHEPFFVKNLETIQGDERDVIFLSVGYGADATGRVTLNFGPLNRDGGWRRLNVLVTRARERCVLFSSIRAEQLHLDGSQARGVVALKEYLHFAEHGMLIGASMPAGEHDSPFEADVCRALRDHGWEVHAQVGAAGFSIDLGVIDPEQPGRYLAGIECDGATYHSSATARDRDRLRQDVLENRLGWKIVRVWSTDWFHRREAVLDRLLRRLDELRRDRRTARFGSEPLVAEPPPGDPVDGQQTLFAPAGPLREGVSEYVRPAWRRLGDQSALMSLPTARLAEIVAEIVRSEAPIHEDEALRVFVGIFSTRTSPRSRQAFARAADAAVVEGLIRRRDRFLWRADDERVDVRYRGDGCPVRDPGMIAPEEFEEAVRLALDREFGLRGDALVASVARLMGFGRRGASLNAAIADAIASLEARREIVADPHGFLVLRSGA